MARPSENLYPLQICVRGWVSVNPQHRDDLAFVVKCVGYDVQQDKSRTPQFTPPSTGRCASVVLSCSSVRLAR